MKIKKIIKCKFIGLTKIKEQQLKAEYNNIQELLQLERQGLDFLPIYDKISLYSANKQQALRFYREIKKDKEYPLSIRKDLIRMKKRDTKLAEYWCRIPVKSRRGGLWLPIKPHREFPEKFEFGESKVFRKENRKGVMEWWIYITVVREVNIKELYSNILAIDLGSKVTATVCGSFDSRPIFYGRNVRGIRRHYQYLRAVLGEKKLLGKIKLLGNKEQRTVRDTLHKISKEIADLAEQTDSYIVIGDLKGIRKLVRGRTFRRIVNNMPFYTLTKMIEYKANERGIKIVKVPEKGTSITCSRCDYRDSANRRTQGLFRCKQCGFEINADVNGARNLMRFSEGYMLPERAVSEPVLNSIYINRETS